MFGLHRDSEIIKALRDCRRHFLFAFLFNCVANVLLLAYPIFMWQVYGRVLASQRVETLVALFVGFLIALVFKGVFMWLTNALMVRSALRLDRLLSDRLFSSLVERSSAGRAEQGSHVFQQFDHFRQFVTGKGGTALIDMPWAILFLGVLMIIDVVVGTVALIAYVALSVATALNSIATKRTLLNASFAGARSNQFAEEVMRGAEAVVGMGMINAVVAKWRVERNKALELQTVASEGKAVFSATQASASILIQGTVMAVGVVQVLFSGAPPAMLFAILIVARYAMRPIDQVILAWNDYVETRQAVEVLEGLIAKPSRLRSGMSLPAPSGALTCKDVYFAVPGQNRAILQQINWYLPPGQSLGLIGLNGAGKTTLARILVGALRPTRGHVRIDGADVWDSDREDMGRYIGYLPQSVSLLPGTVAENVGRFGTLSKTEVVDATKIAGAHDLILKLPNGYDTLIGEQGHPLSGGQRQLIGLARAIAGSPSVVVLDEPNSNLDGPAENALLATIEHLRQAKITLILISHRPNLMRNLDRIVVLRDGTISGSGEGEQMLMRLGRQDVVKKIKVEKEA